MENTVNVAPRRQLKTNKSLLKTILLSMITCGIYPLIVMSEVSTDINVVASAHDGKNTMHFCKFFARVCDSVLCVIFLFFIKSLDIIFILCYILLYNPLYVNSIFEKIFAEFNILLKT